MAKIGSFRDSGDLKKILPEDLFAEIFDDEIARDPNASKISVDITESISFLNNGAFGRPYDKVRDLAAKLRGFADSNPDVFYDQACLPLVRYSNSIACQFFGSENVIFAQNCSNAMKSIFDGILKNQDFKSIGYLQPIYGATQKLLDFYLDNGSINEVVVITPGGENHALVEENAEIIVRELKSTYSIKPFDILVCDETSSQSGRILPLDEVSKFCNENGITLIIDGTQSCQLLCETDLHSKLNGVHYFVMSTHKWLGNIKTCAVIRFKDGVAPPSPSAISFGWKHLNSNERKIDDIKSQFLWTGMGDSYFAQITLGLALKIFSIHGVTQTKQASELLSHGLHNIVKVEPLLPEPSGRFRVMNIFKLEVSQFKDLKDINAIQNQLQNMGIYVSVKKFGADCGSGAELCSRKSDFYLRVSCWSYNTQSDMENLNFALTNNLRLSALTTEALKDQFIYIFDIYDKLFSVLDPKAFFIRAEALRHHLIFYYGHTAVFYINKLFVSGHLKQRINSRLESTLSVGVDEMSWDDILENNYDWTKMTEDGRINFLDSVRDYRQSVRKLVLEILDERPVVQPLPYDSIHWVLLMGMEHEKIHLETSAVIIAQVPIDLIKQKHDFTFPMFHKVRPDGIAKVPQEVPDNKLVRIVGGQVRLGKDFQEQDIYGWDNEFGREIRNLEPFEVSQMLVSNAEYLKFILDGGYTESGKRWWTEEGWKYVKDMNVTGPRFWIGTTHYRAMLEIIPMPWNYPVEVNNLEAEAFCNWKSEHLVGGKKVRLISHEESVHMRLVATHETFNHNLNKFASPTPVNLYGGTIDGQHVYDISGNVWRHSVSLLTIMDGFKIDPFYDDFTIPTIDGHHNHILGGSWISLGNCANVNARYGFRRHFYQFAGIRYVCSNNQYHDKVPKIYNSALFGKMITEHYKDFVEEVDVPERPVRNWPTLLGQISAEVIKADLALKNRERIKVMVAHGSVGRTTLELLRNCSGLDIFHTDRTANLIQVLESLLTDSKVQWLQLTEGVLESPMEYCLSPEETHGKLLDPKGNTIHYWQADYRNIRPVLDHFDVVVVDFRYENAAEHLQNIVERLNPGGLLILASIDDVNNNNGGPKNAVRALGNNFTRETFTGFEDERFAHIVQSNKNLFEYAISNLSFWRKNNTDSDRGVGSTQQQITTLVQIDNGQCPDQFVTPYATHYTQECLWLDNFPKKMAEICVGACKKFNVPMNLALEAGCGPGRPALDLSSHFNHVQAYDINREFISMLQGEQKKRGVANIISLFGDTNNQMNLFKGKRFNLILGSNLIEKLNDPTKWILQSKDMLQENGLLIVSSTFNWNSEITPPGLWIGGYKKNGENLTGVDALKELVGPELGLLESLRVPMANPTKEGTFQLSYSNVMVFGRQK